MSDQLCRCQRVDVVDEGDREETGSNSSDLSYVDAPIAPPVRLIEGPSQEVNELVDINPGGYELVCDLATN